MRKYFRALLLILSSLALLSGDASLASSFNFSKSKSLPGPSRNPVPDKSDQQTNELRNQYRLHSLVRNLIAARLDECWLDEHDVAGERDRLGRAGDMASVIRLERQLLSIRQEIDRLRIELARENKTIANLDDASK